MQIDLPQDIIERAARLAGDDGDAVAILGKGLDRLESEAKEVAAVMEGIADAEAGRTQPLADFDAKMRAELGIPPHA